MSKEEKYYWHGKGSILIGSDTYIKGQEIPVDGIPEERLEKYIADGKISTAEVKIESGASETALKAEIRELKQKYTELLNETRKAKDGKKGGKCKDCPKKDKEIKALKKSNEELKQDVEEKDALIKKLGEDLEAATAPPVEDNK
jgi:predicted RNase H-like nuclease (RuvC/YqgF family)